MNLDNKIWTVIGKKGSGKSHLVADMVRYYHENNIRDKIILLDSSRDYIDDKKLNFFKYAELEQIKDNLDRFNFHKLIDQEDYILFDLSGLSRENFLDTADQIAKSVYQFPNSLIIVEEAYLFVPKMRQKSQFEVLISGGRKKGIDQIYITQRFQQLNLLVFSQTDVLISFRLNESRSIKKMLKHFPEITAEDLKKLKKRECLVFDGENKEKRKNTLF